MSTMLQGKTYILLMSIQQKQKLKMAAKDWTDDKTFQFRNDLLWTGLRDNYFLWAKTF